MTKPKLYHRFNLWWCSCRAFLAAGTTITKAYENWQEMRRNSRD